MRIFLLTAGIISLLLGAIGAFIPLLPTTPFILLSAYLFGKSSPRLHQYLVSHKVFGNLLHDFYEKRALSIRTKVIALLSMWTVLVTSAILFMPFLWARIAVISIGAGVTIWLLRFPMLKE